MDAVLECGGVSGLKDFFGPKLKFNQWWTRLLVKLVIWSAKIAKIVILWWSKIIFSLLKSRSSSRSHQKSRIHFSVLLALIFVEGVKQWNWNLKINNMKKWKFRRSELIWSWSWNWWSRITFPSIKFDLKKRGNYLDHSASDLGGDLRSIQKMWSC